MWSPNICERPPPTELFPAKVMLSIILSWHLCGNSFVECYLYSGRKAPADIPWQAASVRWRFSFSSFPVMHNQKWHYDLHPSGVQVVILIIISRCDMMVIIIRKVKKSHGSKVALKYRLKYVKISLAGSIPKANQNKKINYQLPMWALQNSQWN